MQSRIPAETDRRADASGAPLTAFAALAAFAAFVVALETAMSGGIPRDQLEAVFWGREGVSVSNKHPAGSGWVHYGWLLVFGNSALSGHAIGAVNALLAMGLLWALLARIGFAPARIAEALWLTGASVNFYSLVIKYNANAAPAPFWLITLFGLWVAVAERRAWGWPLAAAAAAGAALMKYHTALFLAVAFLWLLGHAAERRVWRTPGSYLAAALFALPMGLHLWDLARWGWPGIGYGLANVTHEAQVWGHVLYPLQYAALQIVFALPGLGVAAWSLHTARRAGLPVGGLDARGRFLLWFGAVFPLAPVAVALVTGGSLGTHWGIGTAFLAVPFLLHLRGESAGDGPNLRRAARFGAGTLAAFALLLLAAQPLRDREYPVAEIMAQVEAALSPGELAGLVAALGRSREAQGSTWYLPGHPRYVQGRDWSVQPWTARHLAPGDLVLVEGEVDRRRARRLRVEVVRAIPVQSPRTGGLDRNRGYVGTFTLARYLGPSA